MPPDRNIKGNETITYINNSSDTIKNPSIKLFINIHKPGAPRDFPAQADYLTSGVHVDAITVNGANDGYNRCFTIHLQITGSPLSKPLMPHDSLHLTF